MSDPLCYLFRESAPTEAPSELFGKLGFVCEAFGDPKAYLLKSRSAKPALFVIDFTTKKCEVASALTRTIVANFPPGTVVAAVVPPSGQALAGVAPGSSGSVVCIELPLSDLKIARALASCVSTPQILALTGVATGAADSAPLEAMAVPSIIEWVFDKVVPLLINVGRDLEFHEDPEVQLKLYAERLEPIKDPLIAYVKKARRSEESLDLLQSLRALGLGITRNFAVTRAIVEAVTPRAFDFVAKTGAPTHEAKTTLVYTTRMTDRFGEGSYLYPIAYCSGVVYDLLAAVISREVERGPRRTALLRFLDDAFLDGFRRIDIGIKAGKKVEDLALARHLISTLLLRQAGKVIMAVHFDDYLDLYKALDAKKLNKTFQLFTLESRYGLAHNLVGALLSQCTPHLGPAVLPVLFSEIPVHLRNKGEHDASELAAFCRTL